MKIHHVAFIVSDVEKSLDFYQRVLGFRVKSKNFREDRNSWKIDLVRDEIQLEMFTFPESPVRASRPEARGLRHLAFAVPDIESFHRDLKKKIPVEHIRLDQLTGKRFFFFEDPDALPLEIYEA